MPVQTYIIMLRTPPVPLHLQMHYSSHQICIVILWMHLWSAHVRTVRCIFKTQSHFENLHSDVAEDPFIRASSHGYTRFHNPCLAQLVPTNSHSNATDEPTTSTPRHGPHEEYKYFGHCDQVC